MAARQQEWLGQQEHRHKVVLYQCDSDMTKWTSLCLRQADVIFDLVAANEVDEDEDESVFEVTAAEHELEVAAKRIRKELILLHRESVSTPARTSEWLSRRPWISAHFHVKAPPRVFSAKGKAEKRLVGYYSRTVNTQVRD